MGLPEMTVDMDGVLCRPAMWMNLVISRDIDRIPNLEPSAKSLALGRSIAWFDSRLGQSLRYGWRPPMPLVREGLVALAEVRRLVLLTGRPASARQPTERWLIRNGLRDFFSELAFNDRYLSNAAFKLLTARERGITHHVDDDGRVAYFLAQEDNRTVFLIDWPRNQGLPYPATVRRVRNLVEVAEHVRQLASP